MSRIRNPRYAPEFLERRLSPSSFGIAPFTAEVSSRAVTTPKIQSEEPLPIDADGDPIPEPASDGEPGQTAPI